MDQFTLEFRDKTELREIWRRSFAAGICFIPTQKTFPVHSHFHLLLKSKNSGILIPARVIQILEGTSPGSSGMVLELVNYRNYREPINHLIEAADDDAWTDLKDFTEYENEKGKKAVSDELRRVRKKAEKILDERVNRHHYDILGVDRSASQKEIRDAFFEMTREFHPDNYEIDLPWDVLEVLEKTYKKISQAYDTLKNSKIRGQYDETLGGELVRFRGEGRESFQDRQEKYSHGKKKRDFREQVEKAERLFEEALVAIRKGDPKAAKTNIQIALKYDPNNSTYKKKLKELGS